METYHGGFFCWWVKEKTTGFFIGTQGPHINPNFWRWTNPIYLCMYVQYVYIYIDIHIICVYIYIHIIIVISMTPTAPLKYLLVSQTWLPWGQGDSFLCPTSAQTEISWKAEINKTQVEFLLNLHIYIYTCIYIYI